MKHLLNNMSEEEKNAIREQHTGGMKVMTENFSKLLNSKLGDAKPIVEQKEEENEGIFDSLMGKKHKKIDTLKHGGHEIDVFSNGDETLYGHPRKEGERPSYVSHNLAYDDLEGLKKSIDTMNSGDENDFDNWQSSDSDAIGTQHGGSAVPSIFPKVVKKIKNPDFKGYAVP